MAVTNDLFWRCFVGTAQIKEWSSHSYIQELSKIFSKTAEPEFQGEWNSSLQSKCSGLIPGKQGEHSSHWTREAPCWNFTFSTHFSPTTKNPESCSYWIWGFFFFFLQHSSEILHSISLLQIKISHHQMHTIIGAGCWPGVGNGAWAPTQMQQLTEHCDPQHHHPANPHHSSARICAAVSSCCTKFSSLKPFCATDHEFKHLNIIK